MNTSTFGRGLGITAGLDAGLARDLAARCEQLGYHSLWSNDEPASPGLETLAHFATTAPQLTLGVGALPLDRHQPVRIAAQIDRLGLDPTNLWIGIGSGQLRSPIEIIQRAVAELRELLPERLASLSQPCDHGCAASVARSPTASCSTGCCPRKRRRRADGCTKAPRRLDERPRSSLRTSASPWAPARGSVYATRSGTTARSTTAIVSISRPWTSRSGASAWPHPNDQQYSKDWRHTTPRSTFPSHACSQNTMRLRSSPSQMPRRPVTTRTRSRRTTATDRASEIGA